VQSTLALFHNRRLKTGFLLQMINVWNNSFIIDVKVSEWFPKENFDERYGLRYVPE